MEEEIEVMNWLREKKLKESFNQLEEVKHKSKTEGKLFAVRDLQKYEKLYELVKFLKWGNLGYPYCIKFGITNRCYCRCSMCNMWKSKPKIDLKKDTILKAIENGNTKTVVFMGGEPMSYEPFDDFLNLLTQIKLMQVDIGIITSGTPPKRFTLKVMDHIINTCRWIRFSLDASNPKTYKLQRGVDAFNSVVEEIKYFRNKIDMRINFTIWRDNVDDVLNMNSFAKSLGVPIKFWKANFYTLPPEKEIEFIKELDWFEFKKSPAKNCWIPHLVCQIDEKGDVYGCCHVYDPMRERHTEFIQGNIYKDNMYTIFNSKEAKAIREIMWNRPISACYDCSADNLNWYIENHKDIDVFL